MHIKNIYLSVSIIVIFILLSGGVFIYLKKTSSNKSSQVSSDNQPPKPIATDSLPVGGDISTNNGKAAATNSNTSAGPQPQKPTLTKSASVAPKNVPIDFTCFGSDGSYCLLVLKNKNSGQVIEFEKKVITTDKTGQSTANWIWQTISGSWEVVATLYSTTGQSALSEAQSIQVKQ